MRTLKQTVDVEDGRTCVDLAANLGRGVGGAWAGGGVLAGWVAGWLKNWVWEKPENDRQPKFY